MSESRTEPGSPSPSGGRVRVGVLGPLRVEIDGVAADPGRRRQRAVLTRLAVAAGDVVSTDLLVEDLWHGEPPPRAMGALQSHVSHLRRLLEPDRPPRAPASVLVSAAPGYALRLGPAGLDTARVTALLDSAAAELAGAAPAVAETQLREALAQWAGPSFAEFAHEPWAAPEAARFEELRLVAHERLAEARLALGRAAAAVPDLERIVHDHPMREGAVRLLALALYREGRQGDALAAMARARRRLADDLGVDPGAALRELERDLLAQAPHVLTDGVVARAAAASSRVADVVPGPVETEPPAVPDIVGRTAELARLASAAERAASGEACLVLVSADAGGGKTALVEAFRAAGIDAGWTTALGRCPEVDGAPPAWAWREVVEELVVAHPPSAELTAGLAPLRAAAGPAAPEQTFWLARAVVEHLGAVAARRPLLLVVDDLHRAEGETLQLLRSVVGGLAAAPVLVVATLRPSEVGPDLEAALAALAGPIADRIELPGLSHDAVRALLHRHGIAAPAGDTVARVAERTGGNPLFVRETARLIAVEGEEAADREVPAGVRDVLRRRLARLPAPAQTVLRHAAVLGRDVDVDALLHLATSRAAGAGGEDAVLDALEMGVISGLLTEPTPGLVRFAHALVCDTLYADIPRLRRTRLHAAALDAVTAARPGDRAALAHHALAAGPAVPPRLALEHAAGAAAAADRFGAHREASRLWGAAVGLAGPAGADAHRELALRCAHVSALAHSGNARAALEGRAAAVELARPLGDLLATARALAAYDAPVAWTIRQDQAVDVALVALLEETIAALPVEERALRVRLLAALCFELEGDDDARVRSAGAEAMEISAGLGDPALRCAALNARFFAVLAPDLWDELEGVGKELLATAEAAGLADYRTQGHHVLLMADAARHDLDGAQRHADAAVAAATGGQLGFVLGWSATFTAMRSLVAGRFDEAEAAYDEVARRMVAAGTSNGAEMGALGRFAVRHARGDLAGAVAELRPMHVRIPARVADPFARALVAAGLLDEARAVWRPDEPVRRDYYWLYWTAMRAEVAVALGDREVAAVCAAELGPYAHTVAGISSGSVTLGPVAQVLAALAGLLGRPDEERSAHLRAAAAVARGLGAAHWVDRAEQALPR